MDRTDFIIRNISQDLSLGSQPVSAVVGLLDEKATIPFIARYRKERTCGLDEIAIRSISERLAHYHELEKRKETILKTIQEQGKLTDELSAKILLCTDKNLLEDIYLPFKPKKRTRAAIAREKGLEGLAEIIFLQLNLNGSKTEIVAKFIKPELGVNSYEEAIAGALDIIAERISETGSIRQSIRDLTLNTGRICSNVKKDWKEKPSKFQDYYDFSEPVQKSPSHRLLAIRRGEAEEVLSWKITVDEVQAVAILEKSLVRNHSFLFYPELKSAIEDCLKRLLFPAVESEVFNLKLDQAEQEAIQVFSSNLRNLLLSAPAGQKVILGVDPGFRTGCKLAVIDAQGNFQFQQAIFPLEPHNRKVEAEKSLSDIIQKYGVQLIAIGNGTASRETDQFVRELIKRTGLTVKSVVVSEAGASVYSASLLAIQEFPDLDVTVRGAISIARRLQDPLSELVKIDPKAIGVGQYQHDVNQKELKSSLETTVESCVNHVGVQLNTASMELLKFVSGIGPALAGNIVKFRSENGPFLSRKSLLKVPKLGPKAFEQCAGFLRIHSSENPLDNSAIHPETYHLVKTMAADLGFSETDLIGRDISGKIDLNRYISAEFGLLTLTDILRELKKPGLDPRAEFKSMDFSADLNSISDLKDGMILDGVVTNVTNFGAFVDIGVHQDGLVHISKLARKFVKNPSEIVSVGDRVRVKILSVNRDLKRISLERLEN
ncbi:MAG: Tex family protein [Candidatus Wallbacteria bacterium]|nr:Tex family protein [Candidatus Wallbacteria bacterium]